MNHKCRCKKNFYNSDYLHKGRKALKITHAVWSRFLHIILHVCIHFAAGRDADTFRKETLNNFMLRTWPNEFLTAQGTTTS